ncbi:MAG: murein biosynthesis integral membrane protein MurJ [Desulfobacter sp.]|nr:MAG: murein biosynthesis integral membrane protein MurJ [Desulfobacter sp.]
MVSFFRKAASISGITLCSRILGMIRDALIAFVFGASLTSDVFFIVFRPFDLLRKMMSEGLLSVSFIPVFSSYLACGRKDQAVSMFLSAVFIIVSLSAGMICLGFYFAPAIIKLLAPGYAQDLYAVTLGALLFKIMLPYLLTILGVALSMGGLNSLGSFHVPAFIPVLLNLTMIGAALFLADKFHPKILALGVGVTLGGIAQLVFHLPSLIKFKMLDFKHFVFFHPGVIQTLKNIIPSMVGAAAFQVNILVAGLWASTLIPGAVSFLYYAERLVQLPLALFAVSLSTVFFPLLAGRAATQSLGLVQPAFEAGIRLVFFLTIPAMAGIMALNRPIVAVLFGRGAFDSLAVAHTGRCLFFLAAGLWAVAGTRIFASFHQALSNVWLPFAAGMVTIVTNLCLVRVLADVLGVEGLALSVCLSSVAGFIILLIGSLAHIRLTRILVSACRAVFISGIMFFLVRWIWTFWMQGTMIVQAAGLVATIFTGIIF